MRRRRRRMNIYWVRVPTTLHRLFLPTIQQTFLWVRKHGQRGSNLLKIKQLVNGRGGISKPIPFDARVYALPGTGTAGQQGSFLRSKRTPLFLFSLSFPSLRLPAFLWQDEPSPVHARMASPSPSVSQLASHPACCCLRQASPSAHWGVELRVLLWPAPHWEMLDFPEITISWGIWVNLYGEIRFYKVRHSEVLFWGWQKWGNVTRQMQNLGGGGNHQKIKTGLWSCCWLTESPWANHSPPGQFS